MDEYEVSLTLPVEASSLIEAVEEFRGDVMSGVEYVYGVSAPDGRMYTVDAEGWQVKDHGPRDRYLAKIEKVDALIEAVKVMMREPFPHRDQIQRVTDAREALLAFRM